jgi:hypothetical protein
VNHDLLVDRAERPHSVCMLKRERLGTMPLFGRGAAVVVLSFLGQCKAYTTIAEAEGGSGGESASPSGGTENAPTAGTTNAPTAGTTNGGTANEPDGFGGEDAVPDPSEIPLVPDSSGWVDRTTNPVGVQGPWYAFGDQYGPAECLTIGLHAPEECSEIFTPTPGPPGTLPFLFEFPNAHGVMCTAGETAVVLPCPTGLTTEGCPNADYENMWGAGIGFDFNAEMGAEGAARRAWNPFEYDIIGISFDIDQVTLASGLRVEFEVRLTDAEAVAQGVPTGSTSTATAKGSPYWGATSSFPSSPIVPGTNHVLWSDVFHPAGLYPFEPSRIVAMQFHAPAVYTVNATRGAYSFCVSNVKLLRAP